MSAREKLLRPFCRGRGGRRKWEAWLQQLWKSSCILAAVLDLQPNLLIVRERWRTLYEIGCNLFRRFGTAHTLHLVRAVFGLPLTYIGNREGDALDDHHLKHRLRDVRCRWGAGRRLPSRMLWNPKHRLRDDEAGWNCGGMGACDKRDLLRDWGMTNPCRR